MLYNMCLSQLAVAVAIFFIIVCQSFTNSFRIRDLTYDDYGEYNFADKRGDEAEKVACPPWRPFLCPEGDCIHLSYLCEGNFDCPTSHYDESPKLCTAKRRPPMEHTDEFLKDLLDTYGNDYFIKFFGPKAHDRLSGFGGTEAVAIALSESRTLNDFAKEIGLNHEEKEHLGKAFKAIIENDEAILEELEMKPSEASKLKMYISKLAETGFMKYRNL